jgi:hypothetical protein
MMTLLAEHLADIYQAYLDAKPHLETANSTPIQELPYFQLCNASDMMHEVNKHSTSLEILPLNYSASDGLYTDYDTDTDSDGPVTSHDAGSFDYSPFTFIVCRFTCLICFSERPREWLELESLNWRQRGTTDSCPLCHKILFRFQKHSPLHDH